MNRRKFLGGLISAIAAPAIVKPFNIMPVKTIIIPKGIDIAYGSKLLTIEMITREAIKLFKNSNVFIANINAQYDEKFQYPYIVGSQLRIKLPLDYNNV